MTEQYLIDIAFNGQMAKLNLLPPNNHSTFIQGILELKTRKLLAKRADLPGVLAAKMSEPYDTPLHPRTDWPLIVQLIGRYASWYCKQQQNQNEGAPTTREQRVAQIVAERQAKKKEYQRFIEEYWECDSKILDKMRAIEDEIKRIKCGAELFGFENRNKPAPPKGPIWNESSTYAGACAICGTASAAAKSTVPRPAKYRDSTSGVLQTKRRMNMAAGFRTSMRPWTPS